MMPVALIRLIACIIIAIVILGIKDYKRIKNDREIRNDEKFMQ